MRPQRQADASVSLPAGVASSRMLVMRSKEASVSALCDQTGVGQPIVWA
jgi:hypothetical protein